MTLVIYEPETPAMEFIGHAGAGLYGQDPVCAALSILLFTLIEGTPGAMLRSGEGYCRVSGGEARDYALIAGGCRLLAENYPEQVRMEVSA